LIPKLNIIKQGSQMWEGQKKQNDSRASFIQKFLHKNSEPESFCNKETSV
jgi:hypothetical protein